MNLLANAKQVRVADLPSKSRLAELDKVFLEADGRMRVLPAAEVRRAFRNDLERFDWCAKRAIYALVTTELVDWVRDWIGPDRLSATIEVGTGRTPLGSALGVVQTDNYMQTDADIRAYYMALGQAAVEPLPGVLKMDAWAAVQEYRPRAVVATWVTRFGAGQTGIPGVYVGVDYGRVAKAVETFVMVGNEQLHGPMIAQNGAPPPKVYRFPWLLSRSLEHNHRNAIFVWGD